MLKNIFGWAFVAVFGVVITTTCGCGISKEREQEIGKESIAELMSLPSSIPELQGAFTVLEGPVFDEEIGMWKTVVGISLEATVTHRLVFSAQKPTVVDGKIAVIGKIVTNGQYSPPMEDYVFFAK